MVKVEMPRADWDMVLLILEEYARIDWPRDPNPMVMALREDIAIQVERQEY